MGKVEIGVYFCVTAYILTKSFSLNIFCSQTHIIYISTNKNYTSTYDLNESYKLIEFISLRNRTLLNVKAGNLSICH